MPREVQDALRVPTSRLRRVSTEGAPLAACIFPVVYRRPATHRRADASSASVFHPPRKRRRPAGARFAPPAIRAKKKTGGCPPVSSVAFRERGLVFRLLLGIVVLVFLARLAVLALQRRAEDVAEAGARIG